MSGIDRITARIADDALNETAALKRQIKERTDAIRADYERQVLALRISDAERARKAAAQKIERMAGVARLEARKNILDTKQNLISEAFRLAASKLLALNGDRKINALAKIAADASRNGSESLALSPDDHNSIGELVVSKANALLADRALTANLKLAPCARDDINGGLVLSDGDIFCNASFDALLRAAKDSLSLDVARILFD